MNKEEFLTKIWNYYIMLENDFMNTFRYVEPIEDNNKTYSKEYNKLLLSIGSEVDVVAKELCKKIENKTSEQVSRYTIINYKSVLSGYNNFINEKCLNLITTEILIPYSEWIDYDSLTWWKNYNHLKHDRLLNDNIKLGNYINVKNALAGLYILCRVLYKSNYSKEPVPKSNLFQMSGWATYTEMGGGFVNVIDENGNMSLYAN